MAVAAQEDPLTRMRAFVTEKPEQFKRQLSEWTAQQPAWVEGLVTGGTGSFQARRGAWLRVHCLLACWQGSLACAEAAQRRRCRPRASSFASFCPYLPCREPSWAWSWALWAR